MKIARPIIILALLVGLFGANLTIAQAQKLSPYSSTINVQNIGTDTATITIKYYNQDGSVATSVDDTLSVNQSKNYITLPVDNGFNGSAVISSSQPLAVLSNLNHTNSSSVAVARESYLGSSEGAETVYLPLLTTKLGAVSNDTWFSIQNVGTDTATVNVTYSDCTTGNPTGISIPQGASYVINNAVDTCHTTKAYAGVVTSNQPVVVVVVQEKAYNNSAYQTGVMYSYTGLTNNGSPVQIFPVVTFNNSGNRTGIQVQNTTATDTTITIQYMHDQNNLGTNCTETQNVPANSSVTFGWPAWIASNPSYTGSSTCTRGQTFIGSAYISVNSANVNVQTVVSQIKDGTNRAAAYTGFQPSQATGKIVMPLIMDRVGSSSLLVTYLQIFNNSTNPAYVKCEISGTSSSGDKTYEITDTIPAQNSARYGQLNQIAAGFVGSGYCETYTDNTFATLDSTGEIFGVVNQVSSIGNYALAAANWDSLQIYTAINTAQPVE
jgi:hypothetical protein